MENPCPFPVTTTLNQIEILNNQLSSINLNDIANEKNSNCSRPDSELGCGSSMCMSPSISPPMPAPIPGSPSPRKYSSHLRATAGSPKQMPGSPSPGKCSSHLRATAGPPKPVSPKTQGILMELGRIDGFIPNDQLCLSLSSGAKRRRHPAGSGSLEPKQKKKVPEINYWSSLGPDEVPDEAEYSQFVKDIRSSSKIIETWDYHKPNDYSWNTLAALTKGPGKVCMELAKEAKTNVHD